MICTLDEIEQSFIDSLKNITAFIDLTDLIKSKNYNYMKNSKFYKETENSFNIIKEQLTNTKVVQYNAIIISLYGAYELAIKKATNTFIMFSINSGFSLSDKLINNYLISVSKTFERNKSLDNKYLIRDLHLFLNKNDVSKFRTELSLNNYQNLKTAIVQQISKSIGINNLMNDIKNANNFVKYIQERENISSFQQAVDYIKKLPNPFNFIDDIVDCRNRIAHNGYEDNMLNNEIIKDVVIKEFRIFVLEYIHLLKNCWYQECIKYKKNIKKLKILNVFNSDIICFNSENLIVSKNNVIVIKNGENIYKFGRILSLQHNKINIEHSLVNQDIGCKLDITCKKNYEYYIFSPA